MERLHDPSPRKVKWRHNGQGSNRIHHGQQQAEGFRLHKSFAAANRLPLALSCIISVQWSESVRALPRPSWQEESWEGFERAQRASRPSAVAGVWHRRGLLSSPLIEVSVRPRSRRRSRRRRHRESRLSRSQDLNASKLG